MQVMSEVKSTNKSYYQPLYLVVVHPQLAYAVQAFALYLKKDMNQDTNQF